MATLIRPATEDDIPQIWEIFDYYVLNTTISFLTKSPTQSYIRSRFRSSKGQGLPYLVATADNKVVGYTYASGYRGFMIGYAPTVEITIFCRPEYKGKGIGHEMMGQLLEQLRGRIHVSSEVDHEGETYEAEVKQVLAIMSSEGQDSRLMDWYCNWGFREVGRLRNVGFKMNRWYEHQFLYVFEQG